MLLPGQRAAIARAPHAASFHERAESGVTPQEKFCTPCQRVGGGQWCVNVPRFGRRFCFNVPTAGSWKVCCQPRWSLSDPFGCRLTRC
jgi:hypothetical protein